MAVTLAACGMAAGCGAETTPGGPRPGEAATKPMEAGRQPAARQFPSLAESLRALATERLRLVDTGRNPFRMGSTAAAEPAAAEPAPTITAATPVVVPAPRGSEPDTALRLIGMVEAPGNGGRIVVVSDGEQVHYGRVGDVVAGRYRLVALDGSVVTVEDLAHGALHRLRFGGS